jgi:hypothetical protein
MARARRKQCQETDSDSIGSASLKCLIVWRQARRNRVLQPRRERRPARAASREEPNRSRQEDENGNDAHFLSHLRFLRQRGRCSSQSPSASHSRSRSRSRSRRKRPQSDTSLGPLYFHLTPPQHDAPAAACPSWPRSWSLSIGDPAASSLHPSGILADRCRLLVSSLVGLSLLSLVDSPLPAAVSRPRSRGLAMLVRPLVAV